MSVTVTQMSFPGFCANCYLVTDQATKESFLVDPGAYGKRQSEYIRSQGIERLSYILLTHGHYDHIMGAAEFKEDFGGEVVIHQNDEAMLSNDFKSLFIFSGNGSSYPHVKADKIVGDGDILPFSGGDIRVIHTPGHTKGCVCYCLDRLLFTGDTLFNMSIGRTDFPGGSYKQLLSSLKKLSELQGDFRVLPGHEEETTLERERQNNPAMRGI